MADRSPFRALILLEDGIELYRRSFSSDLWLYYVSSAPLALALLYFWGRARTTVMPNLWAPALLLTVFAGLRLAGCGAYSRRLLQRTGAQPAETGAAARLTEIGTQAVLVVLWVATLPLVLGTCLIYTAAQYAPLTGSGGLRISLRWAWRWWSGQWSQAFWGLIFAAILLVNFLTLALLLPALLHALLGANGAWTRAASRGHLAESPLLWASLAGAVYLALDPLYKCVTVLSYSRLRALEHAADLHLRIRALARSSNAGVPMSRVFVAATPLALQKALRIEFQRPVYAWHGAHPSPWWPGLERGAQWLLRPVLAGWAWAVREIGRFVHWLLQTLLGRGQGAVGQHGGQGWQLMVWAIIVFALALICVLLRRRKRLPAPDPIPLSASAGELDVAAGHASEAAAARWFEEAKRLESIGEYRLAMRAAFLGTLADFGEHRFLTLRRDRTNAEYCDELRRRAGLPAAHIEGAFAAAAQQFEAVWYGGRELNGLHCKEYIARQQEWFGHG